MTEVTQAGTVGISLTGWIVCAATVVIAVASIATWQVYRRLANLTAETLAETRRNSEELRTQVSLLAKQISIFDEFLTILFVIEREKGSGDIQRQTKYGRVMDKLFPERLAKITETEQRQKQQDDMIKVLSELSDQGSRS